MPWLPGLALVLAPAQRVELYQAVPSRDIVPQQPYKRYLTRDKFGRVISFFVSEGPDAKALPLVVFVQGSGWNSLFSLQNGRTVPMSGHISMTEAAAGKARVLIVEKPGVDFMSSGRDAAPPAFKREHTLERWAEAVEASVRAAHTLPYINSAKTLIVGHSEGGLVACRVAHDLGSLSAVAMIAGGGASQLFDLIGLARSGAFFSEVSEDSDKRVTWLLGEIAKIEADPTNADKEFFGHSYRRWSSFLATSPMRELDGVKSRIYILQGAADSAVNPASADLLASELAVRGQNFLERIVPGADHNLQTATGDLWVPELTNILNWFLSG